MPTKYIRNQHRFIVFPDSAQHRETARKGISPDALIHGAGFMRLVFDGEKLSAQCYGESESLNRKPRHDDHIAILKSIGVENQDDSEVEHAKYLVWRDKVVVFSNDLEHKKVAEGAFYGKTNCDSAGFIKFLVHPSGKVKIQCYGESTSLGVSAKKEDNQLVAELMQLSPDMIFVPPVLKY